MKDAKSALSQLSPKALAAAQKLPNGSDNAHVQKALSNLEGNLLPAQAELASKVAEDPTNAEYNKELEDVTNKIKEELDNIRDYLHGKLQINTTIAQI